MKDSQKPFSQKLGAYVLIDFALMDKQVDFVELKKLQFDAEVGIGMLMGESLTFGYLMLDDALGVPYYRLINVR